MQVAPAYDGSMIRCLLPDCSVQRIADHFQLSANTVKSHVRRSLPLLRISFLNRTGELDEYLLTLPIESQQTIRLFVTLGPNCQEIAKRLGPPHTPDTVRACIEQ